MFALGWFALFLIGGIFEVYALFRKTRGDTLSEQVWKLRSIWAWRSLVFSVWVWLSFHFFIEGVDKQATLGYADLVALLIGFVLAQVVTYRKNNDVQQALLLHGKPSIQGTDQDS